MAAEKDITADTAGQQRELLRELLLKKAGQPEKVAASCAQRRLWLVDQLEQPNASYNNPFHVTIKGSLDVALLEQSFNLLIARHGVLRTTFIDDEGNPLQSISPELKVDLPYVDLTANDGSVIKQRVAEFITEESAFIFDLASGPLFRLKLLHIGNARQSAGNEDEFVLIIVLHHVVSDGWSIGVMTRDLFAIYDDLKNNRNALKPIPLQYSDFSRRQSQWLKSDDFRRQLDYWKQRLLDLPTLELRTDFPRPPVKRFEGASLYSRLDGSLVRQSKALCQQHSVTLSMLLSATFSLLLHRYTGQHDIVFGSPIASRKQPDVENLIGFFANMLVIRNRVEPADNFPRLLAKTRATLIEAYSNQDAPFEVLVDELQPVRDRSRNPLFQVLFAMQNEIMPVVELEGLTIGRPVVPGYDVSEYEVATKVTRFDIELHCWEDEQGVRCSWVYDTELFDAARIKRMQRHFANLLAAAVAEPDRPLESLPMLGEHEREQIVKEWNRTDADFPLEMTLQQLFEAQVDLTPDATALEFGEQTLSYLELDERANRVAHYLGENGVGPGRLVGVYMERSLEMVVSLYGIIKSGAAYVPLDPEYPEERIAYMLDESRVSVLLSQQHLRERLPGSDSRVVCLDAQWDVIAGHGGSRTPQAASAEDLAYVIYTSGSTGRPKGVMNCHRGIVNRLLWMQQAYALTADDRVLQKTPFSFDVSVWEFFWPLITGARLVMAAPEGHKDPVYLSRLIRDRKITTLHFVPSMLRAFLENSDPADFAPVKRVICSGEALPYELQQQFFKLHKAELHNLYGPTEAAVDVSYWACRPDDELRFVPIGRPVANTRLYIVDPLLQPVPVGVSGELCIGGVQVAKGYLGQPELTAEKFIPDPFGDQPGARLYRTGDLACFLPDGAIEYIGRIDNQIKLRGLRIELGEIEHALSDHEAVKDAVVVACEDEAGDKRLVAYLTAAGADQPSADDLRARVRRQLPEYMLPSVFVMLDELPLTASGKLDRNALPAPADGQVRTEAEYAPPRTELERRLTQIWAEILKLQRVGIHDNFFDLGGHSLMATRAVSKLRKALSIELAVSQMFDYPTVAALAHKIELLRWTSQGFAEGESGEDEVFSL